MANPTAFEPDLATSLNNLSNRLAEGMTAITDAVQMYRQLAAANPAAYEPALAGSLNNLSVRLAEAGRRDEAERASREPRSLVRTALNSPCPHEAQMPDRYRRWDIPMGL